MKKNTYTISIIILSFFAAIILFIGLIPEMYLVWTSAPARSNEYDVLEALFVFFFSIPGTCITLLCTVFYILSLVMYRLSDKNFLNRKLKSAKHYGTAQTVFYCLCAFCMFLLSPLWNLFALAMAIDYGFSDFLLVGGICFSALLHTLGIFIYVAFAIINSRVLSHRMHSFSILNQAQITHPQKTD